MSLIRAIGYAGMATVVLASAHAAAGVRAGRTQGDEARVIDVVARRFAFEPARIEVTEGETVRLVVRSADGVHGIDIRKFRVSETVPRGGDPIAIEFTATAAGEFEIACSQYCGKGHGQMKGRLIVLPRGTGPR